MFSSTQVQCVRASDGTSCGGLVKGGMVWNSDARYYELNRFLVVVWHAWETGGAAFGFRCELVRYYLTEVVAE